MDDRREKVGELVAQSRTFNIQLIEIPVRKNRENGGEEIMKDIQKTKEKNFFPELGAMNLYLKRVF